MTSITPPPCPDCSTATERIDIEGEEVWRCSAPDCTRRTYATGDPDDDDCLPGYSETGEHGAVICFHGTGEIGVEATAELADQDVPTDRDDESDAAGPTPGGWEPQVHDVRVKDLAAALTGAWVWIYGDPEGWRYFTDAAYDPDHDTTVTITYSDGEVVKENPWPMARMVHADPETIPTASRPGPAGLVKR
ncbi:hypothetical protein AB0E27_41305 [Streptomyces sparsogenes]|uniref:hypothetical protein n=1 Tax=Streptomyces sparsogenes TaxID=67365 RepID=UPI0033FF2324